MKASINKYNLTEKESNIYSILSCIKEVEEISASEIAERTGLSLATISRVLKYSQDNDLVIKKGKEKTGLGRRPDLFGFNNSYGCVINFIINNECIQGTLADLNGDIIDTNIRYIESDIKTKQVLDILKNITNILIERNGIERGKLLAAMIGIPGVVDEKRGIIHKIPNLPDWENKNIFSLIEKQLEVPVLVENDSNLSAIGEKIKRFNRYDNLVLIEITNKAGIGAGIIINNLLYKGSTNSAGEIGHMFFNQNNYNKAFTDLGCLESYSGIQALYNRVSKAMDLGEAPILTHLVKENSEKLTLSLIEKSVILGDFIVGQLLDDVIRIWSIAIVNICSVLDPHVIILGGAIKKDNKFVFDEINKYVEKGLGHAPMIHFAESKEETQVIGGMHILLDYVFDHLIIKKHFNYL